MLARIVAGLTIAGLPRLTALLVALALAAAFALPVNLAVAQNTDPLDCDPADWGFLNPAQLAFIQAEIDQCQNQGWQVRNGGILDCYCDIPGGIASRGDSSCSSAARACDFSHVPRAGSFNYCQNHFGPTLRYLPEKTDANADDCFVSHCPDGMEPSGFNMNGETDCCPTGMVHLEGGGCGCPEDSFLLPNGECYEQLPIPAVCMTFTMHDEYQNQLSACHNRGWNVKEIIPGSDIGCYCDVQVKHDDDAECDARFRCQLTAGVGGNQSCREHFGFGLAHLPQISAENYDACFVSHCPGVREPSGINMNGATECVCPAAYVDVGGECELNIPGAPAATVLAGSHFVSVSWGAAVSVGLSPRYEVQRQAGGGAFMSVAAVAALFYVDEAAAAGTTLRYRVRLESAEADVTLSLSAASAATVITALDCAALRLPAAATAGERARGLCGEACSAVEALSGDACVLNIPGTPAATVLSGSHFVSVRWAAAASVGLSPRYEVQRQVDDGAPVSVAVAAELFYVDMAAAAGTRLRYRVRLESADAGVTLSLSAWSAATMIVALDCAALRLPAAATAGARARGLCGEACAGDEILRAGECLAGNQPGTPGATVLANHFVSVSWTAASEAGDGALYVVWRTVNNAAATAAATVGVLHYVDEEVGAGWTVSYRASLHHADAIYIASEASGPVVIPDLDCDAFLRTPGERGSCGECLPTTTGEDGESVTLRTVALSAAGMGLSAAGPFAAACVATTGNFLGVPEALLCDAFGGTLQRTTGTPGTGTPGTGAGTAGEEGEEGARWVCSGVDAADTFCIADAAAAGHAFACRGLLKHVRRCHWDFKRPALNPFLCAPKCLEVGGVQQIPRAGRCVNP